MSISNSVARLTEYYRRHGLAETMRRARLAAQRVLFARRMVVFYCDLDGRQLTQPIIGKSAKVARLRTLAELGPEHFKEMTSFWNPKLASQLISKRFDKGASLWLLECEGELAGYGWTLEGSTFEPYYFPLTKNDVHLFDFHVFPRFRGLGLNPYLVNSILGGLMTKTGGRAFIEAAEWNEAQLSSLRKTPFQKLGLVRSFTIFGHTFVSWAGGQDGAVDVRSANSADHMLEIAGSNKQ